jgi:effector-binding domain-containing protein
MRKILNILLNIMKPNTVDLRYGLITKSSIIKHNIILQKIYRDYILNKPSQIIYLPSVKHKTLLITSYADKGLVSGMATLTPNEKVLLMNDDVLGQNFRVYLLKILLKVNMDFFSKDVQTLVEGLIRGFDNVYKYSDLLKMPPTLYKIVGDRTTTLIQHMIVTVWNNRDFSFEILRDFCNDNKQVLLDSFEQKKDIKSLTFSEIVTIGKFIKLLKENKIDNFLFNIIDPDNLSKLSFYYQPLDSRKQTDQTNSDLVICDSKGYLEPIYYDVKSMIRMCAFRHLFIFHGNENVYKKLFNSIKSNIHQKIKDLPEGVEKQNLLNISNKHFSIKQEDISDKAKYEKLIRFLLQEIFKNKMEMNFSIGIAAENDFHMDIYYTPELVACIETFAKTQKAKDYLITLFPKIPKIDAKSNIEHQLSFFELVEEYIPHLKENYIKAITL